MVGVMKKTKPKVRKSSKAMGWRELFSVVKIMDTDLTTVELAKKTKFVLLELNRRRIKLVFEETGDRLSGIMLEGYGSGSLTHDGEFRMEKERAWRKMDRGAYEATKDFWRACAWATWKIEKWRKSTK